MLVKIIGILGLVAIIVVAISGYLPADDLATCAKPEYNGKCQKADAIVVISGGDTNARTDEAIKLYKNNWAPLIIVSGAAADKTGPSNAAAMRQRAIDSSVPQDAIITEEKSENTKQNATMVADIAKSRNIKNIILVTSGYHMRRALLEFSARFTDVEVRAHAIPRDGHWGAFWWISPWGWWLAGSELVRILAFYIGGIGR